MAQSARAPGDTAPGKRALTRCYPVNEHGRDFVVGDVHGEFAALRHALEDIGFDYDTDRLFSLGDLIDRGPHSDEALAWITEGPIHAAVRGNHEQMLIRYIDTITATGTCDPYALGHLWFNAIPKRMHRQWRGTLDALPIAITVHTRHGPVGLVHGTPALNNWTAGCAWIESGNLDARHVALWRSRWNHTRNHGDTRPSTRSDHQPITSIRTVMVGHTIQSNPARLANVWNIDTGCGERRGQLTIARIDTRAITTQSWHTGDAHRQAPARRSIAQRARGWLNQLRWPHRASTHQPTSNAAASGVETPEPAHDPTAMDPIARRNLQWWESQPDQYTLIASPVPAPDGQCAILIIEPEAPFCRESGVTFASTGTAAAYCARAHAEASLTAEARDARVSRALQQAWTTENENAEASGVARR